MDSEIYLTYLMLENGSVSPAFVIFILVSMLILVPILMIVENRN